MANVKNYREQGGEKWVVGGELDIVTGGKLSLAGTDVTAKLTKQTATTVATKTGADAANKVCLTNGVTLITGGTGIADMTLAAPSPGEVAIIRLASLSSGTVIVTTADGVTFDGTNNTATFDAANEAVMLVYASATAWAIALNVGGVALSSVGD